MSKAKPLKFHPSACAIKKARFWHKRLSHNLKKLLNTWAPLLHKGNQCPEKAGKKPSKSKFIRKGILVTMPTTSPGKKSFDIAFFDSESHFSDVCFLKSRRKCLVCSKCFAPRWESQESSLRIVGNVHFGCPSKFLAFH